MRHVRHAVVPAAVPVPRVRLGGSRPNRSRCRATARSTRWPRSTCRCPGWPRRTRSSWWSSATPACALLVPAHRAPARARRDRRPRGAGVAAGRRALGRPRLRLRVPARRASDERGGSMRRVAMVGAGMTQFGELLRPRHQGHGADGGHRGGRCSVDKGFDRADIQAAWFGELVTTDGFASGILADSCGLLDIPVTRARERVRDRQRRRAQRRASAIASGMFDVVLVVGADKVRETSTPDHVLGLDGHDARQRVGLPTRPRRARRTSRCTSPATCTSRRRHPEHLAMVAVKNHHHGVTNPKAQMRFEITDRAGAQRADGRRAVRALRLHAPERRRGRGASSWREESSTATPTGRCGSAASGSALDRVMHQHKADMTTFPPTVKAAKAGVRDGRASDPPTSTSPRCTTASPVSS